MVTEEQINKLAHSLWEKEGRPEKRDIEFYYRAKKILAERERHRIKELAAPVPPAALPPAPKVSLLPPAETQKRQPSTPRKTSRKIRVKVSKIKKKK